MISTNLSTTDDVAKKSKHLDIIERTYSSNTGSDYTEHMESLGKNFEYAENSNHYWGEPELSIFYGTPLYEQASESQKLALNHLYWVFQYTYVANSEANTMLFNQITEGVFSHFNDYQTLCQELDLETNQERHHIKTFQRVGYKTKLALLGKTALASPVLKKNEKDAKKKHSPAFKQKTVPQVGESSSLESIQEFSFRFITKLMLSGQNKFYSKYLQDKANESIPTTSGGVAGLTASRAAFKFFSLNWGSSPFLASQYYAIRMIANMSLKTYEHKYYKRFKDLKRKDEFIPAPTAVSHFHLLDESFHTTMSQTIAHEVYQDFSQASAYEKLIANITVYMAQAGNLGGFSGTFPTAFRDDGPFLVPFSRLLQSPIFNFSEQETLYWLEKCLCQEHEGFHVNLKYHESLLSDFQRFFGKLEYLWPVNREMQIMAKGASIEKALKKNNQSFKDFAREFVD